MAFGDITAIGSHNSIDAAVTRSITVGVGGVPANKTICVYVVTRDPLSDLTPTCADSDNGAYTPIVLNNTIGGASAGTDVFFFYFKNNAALEENDTITVSNVSSGQAVNMHAFYVDGLDAVSPHLVSQTASGATDATTSGDFAWSTGVQGAQELWLGLMGVAGNTSGTEDPSGDWTAVFNATGSAAGAAGQNRSIRIAKRVVTGAASGVYAPDTGTSQTRFVSVISFRAPSAKVYWYPKTCSEDQGCILQLSGPSTLSGIAKTCIGHSETATFGRQIGLPQYAGLFPQATVTGDDTAFAAIQTQNIAGTEQTIGGGSGLRPFLVFDELRISPPATPSEMTPILVVYQGSLTAPGDDPNVDPPNVTFLRSSFQSIKDNNPGVTRMCFDQEGWWEGQAIPQSRIQFFLTVIDVAHEYWPDVGIYSGLPERYTGYLTVTGQTRIDRYNSWVTRNSGLQQLWDAVNTIYPSVYYLNPTHPEYANGVEIGHTTERDLWYEDTQAICNMFAPGKPVYYFMGLSYHISIPVSERAPGTDANFAAVPAAYWRSTMDKIYSLRSEGATGIVLWQTSGQDDPRTYVGGTAQACWAQIEDFIADNSITAES
jgi:hypothetical protein